MRVKNWKRYRKSENRLAVRVYINTVTGVHIRISKVRDNIMNRFFYFIEMYSKNGKRLVELDSRNLLYCAEDKAEELMRKHSKVGKDKNG